MGDQRIKIGLIFPGLGPQNPAQPLGFFLPGTECARNLDGHRGIGQVYCKIGNLGNGQGADGAVLEIPVQAVPFFLGCRAGDQRNVQVFRSIFQLVDIHPYQQNLLSLVTGHDPSYQFLLGGIFRCNSKFLPLVCHGIGHAQILGKRNTDFAAPGLGNPALLFHLLPWHIHLFGADEGKHILFLAVFTDQSCGESQSPPGLEARRHLKNRGREHMNFIVNNQSPVAVIKKGKVRKIPFPVRTIGHDLVGGDGDLTNLFGIPAVFSDICFRQRGFIQQFLLPLTNGGHIGGEDQRGGLKLLHTGNAHNGFSGTAGQHNDTGPAMG